MSRALDMRVLHSLVRGLPRGGSHADRLQAFYAPQAAQYDSFRARLLHGRRELIALMAPRPGAHVIELGGGTGQTLGYFGDALATMGRVEVIDLCPALLDQARRRWAGWANVRVMEADAATYRPDGAADAVYLSYALTMMPDWRATIDNAVAMLRPGGVLGVVDFYVGARHGALARWFWPRWFAHDGVRLTAEHPARLRDLLPAHVFFARRAPVPYLPGLRVPYYIFAGRKPG